MYTGAYLNYESNWYENKRVVYTNEEEEQEQRQTQTRETSFRGIKAMEKSRDAEYDRIKYE